MLQKNQFIRRSAQFCTLEEAVPAPLFRRVFAVGEGLTKATLWITGLGFYEVHLNGRDITKGFLAPYRSNLDDFIYYDMYDVTDKLSAGDNVLAGLLGNGMQNGLGAYIWDFEKAAWRGAPAVCFILELSYASGETETVVSDPQTKTADSPILFDDLHYGEYYDARLEQPGWDTVAFDDSSWTAAEYAPAPRGELRLCEAEPLVARGELKPVSITPYEDGYIYDFGQNNAGLCRLSIEGEAGQKLVLRYGEMYIDGKPDFLHTRFGEGMRYQEDEYTCKGGEREEHLARFTYHGFQYVLVTGLRPEQATPDLLTYVLISSDLRQNGSFTCSDETVNRIQEIVLRSDISNFHYFPTDCPQREKNGWTADAALSTQQMLFNFTPEISYREWVRNIGKAVNDQGQLPGIVPTGGWGYHWGNGPAWDSILVYLPYFVYIHRGDRQILLEVAVPLMRYLTYLFTRLDARGLLAIGLGDWCPVNGKDADDYPVPLVVTDSILTVDIAEKAAFIYDVLGWPEQKAYAESLADQVRRGVREYLIDFSTFTVEGASQTGQSMAIFYPIFTPAERPHAFARLVELIHANDDFMDIGVLGSRVLFRVLAEYGEAELAYRMITRPEWPSYGNLIAQGATTLWEFILREGEHHGSLNHHFWGDVSAWFYIYLAGMRLNPTGRDVNEVNLTPCFVEGLDSVSARETLPAGELTVEWRRTGDGIRLTLSVPAGVHGELRLPAGWVTADGACHRPLASGEYRLERE